MLVASKFFGDETVDGERERKESLMSFIACRHFTLTNSLGPAREMLFSHLGLRKVK